MHATCCNKNDMPNCVCDKYKIILDDAITNVCYRIWNQTHQVVLWELRSLTIQKFLIFDVASSVRAIWTTEWTIHFDQFWQQKSRFRFRFFGPQNVHRNCLTEKVRRQRAVHCHGSATLDSSHRCLMTTTSGNGSWLSMPRGVRWWRLLTAKADAPAPAVTLMLSTAYNAIYVIDSRHQTGACNLHQTVCHYQYRYYSAHS